MATLGPPAVFYDLDAVASSSDFGGKMPEALVPMFGENRGVFRGALSVVHECSLCYMRLECPFCHFISKKVRAFPFWGRASLRCRSV